MPIFLILFVITPLVELYFLIQVGSEIGALPTIGLSLATALIGGLLARMQGFDVLIRVQQATARGEVPALALLDGALLLIAGLSLLLPGFITDGIGFSLLIPAVRRMLLLRFVRKIVPPPPPSARGYIEGEYRRDGD